MTRDITAAVRCRPGCERPSPDAFLCSHCARSLVLDLLQVPWLTRQLTVTLARLDRIDAPAGSGGREDDADSGTPLPFRSTAGDAAMLLRGTLQPWVQCIAEDRAVRYEGRDTMAAMARWLAVHIESIRQDAAAPLLYDEVRHAIARVRRTIDQPPRLFYAGPCDDPCGADMYCGADDMGRPTSAVIVCRECTQEYETVPRRDWLLAAAVDRIASATDIAQAIPALYGQPISVHTIRTWIFRGRLMPRAWLHDGAQYPMRQGPHDRPLCRIGDVIDLASR